MGSDRNARGAPSSRSRTVQIVPGGGSRETPRPRRVSRSAAAGAFGESRSVWPTARGPIASVASRAAIARRKGWGREGSGVRRADRRNQSRGGDVRHAREGVRAVSRGRSWRLHFKVLTADRFPVHCPVRASVRGAKASNARTAPVRRVSDEIRVVRARRENRAAGVSVSPTFADAAPDRNRSSEVPFPRFLTQGPPAI